MLARVKQNISVTTPKNHLVYLYHIQLKGFYLLVFPGNGLGIDRMGLGVELLRGEQPVSTSFLFVTTQLMSLLRNSSTTF